LRRGNASTEAIASRQFIGIDFIRACFDVDGSELAVILWLEVRADAALVDGIAAFGEFLFAVSPFYGSHDFSFSFAFPSCLLLILDLPPAPIYFTTAFGARTATPQRLPAVRRFADTWERLATVGALSTRQNQPQNQDR
jgi:hypothetical protein